MQYRRRTDAPWNPPARGADVSALFALVVVCGPFLLPALGLHPGDFAFTAPLVVLAATTAVCLAAAGRADGRAGVWRAFAAATALAAAASALAVVSALANAGTDAAFYLGAAGSVGLLVAMLLLARRSVRGAPLARLVDALLLDGVLAATGFWFVIRPGLEHGDTILTLVFAIDLVALLLAGVSLTARRGRGHRRMGWWLAAALVAACVGDGVVSADAAGQIDLVPALTAAWWSLAGLAFWRAADHERGAGEDEDPLPPPATRLAWHLRALMPLLAVLSYPAILGGLSIANALDARALWFYGAFASLSLVLAFGRQAYLLGENRQAIARERRLREQVVRRNEELQALTALATTMTQTLEEGPIVERGLDALRLATRATSSALHVLDRGRLKLRAATGDWHAEHPWASNLGDPTEELQLDRRGGRVVARLPLAVRGSVIGAVTVIRQAQEPFEAQELGLLRLLCDQLGIAIQNARDYGETLEQALRDPLTGLYNRRLFLDALEREVGRTLRHGTSVALAFFDIDDFKQINDTYGHAVGDEVLRQIGRVVETAIRPSDLFARIGGEEFGLLLPDTEQLEALLVAERVRAAVSREPIAEGLRVTVSAGVSELPSDAGSRKELERKADAALYWAKRNGKNMCAVAGEAMEDVPVRP